MKDLSSLTRDRTRAPCSGSKESQPLDRQGTPCGAHSITTPTPAPQCLGWSRPWFPGDGRAGVRRPSMGLRLPPPSSLHPPRLEGQLPPPPEGVKWDRCTWEEALAGLAAPRLPPGGRKAPAGLEDEAGMSSGSLNPTPSPRSGWEGGTSSLAVWPRRTVTSGLCIHFALFPFFFVYLSS